LEQEALKRWAQLKIEREFPWPPVFLAVERVASPDIELLEFKPDKINRRIALRGEARNRKALIVYLGALAAQTGLSNVYLTHQQTVARDTLETIAFEMIATFTDCSTRIRRAASICDRANTGGFLVLEWWNGSTGPNKNFAFDSWVESAEVY
jgi:hypothetical protein